MSIPVIPPRPSRSNNGSSSIPQPVSIAPHSVPEPLDRAQFARSPLNELPDGFKNAPYSPVHSLAAHIDEPERPPSVNLPSIGFEGEEYSTFSPSPGSQAPKLSRNVAKDLPLHQPTAAVPASTAKSRIQTVTSTQSTNPSTTASPVIPSASPSSHDGIHHLDPDRPNALRARASFNQSSASLLSAGSADDSGADSGIHVPMYPDAGIVQAPSPGPPTSTPGSAALSSGFPQDSSPMKHHHRRASSRQEFGPPGSYGLHGHLHEPRDQFERAWYQKHPEERQKELHRVYDPGHTPIATAMSSDDLNKLVHHTSETGIGLATSETAIGGPSEQIGYKASEEYAQQLKHTPTTGVSRRRLSHDQATHPESPLRKTTSLQEYTAAEGAGDSSSVAVHVDSQARLTGKYTGGGYDPPTENLGPDGGNTSERGGWIHEKGDGVPILASDELAKSPGVAMFLQPAMEPEQEKQGDGDYHSGFGSDHPSYQSANARGRPGGTRNASDQLHVESHGGSPLKEIQEFEPLFTEADEKLDLVRTVSRSRPEVYRHFPSSDVWEDTPNSLSLTATVRTPEPENAGLAKPPTQPLQDAAHTFELPSAESARKDHLESTDRAHYLPGSARELAKPKYNRGVDDEIHRPGLARFPSSDVWEDTPDSSQLQTLVGSEQSQANIVDSPEIAARTAPVDSIPAIPRRPSSKTKPVVPARPAGRKPSFDGHVLTKTTSREGSQDDRIGFPKTKPAVPARPTGSKISALKAGFMNDLNSRLQMGPPPPKKEPSESDATVAQEEKAPLVDARKGRAKGPARRSRPTPGADSSSNVSTSSICQAELVFEINGSGELHIKNGMARKSAGEALAVGASETVGALDGHSVPLDGVDVLHEQANVIDSEVVAEPEDIARDGTTALPGGMHDVEVAEQS